METYREFIKRKEEEFRKKKNEDVSFKDISGHGRHIFRREAWTFMPQHNLRTKIFVIERLKRVDMTGKIAHRKLKRGDVEYRFGYYIVGDKKKAKGKWVWGQFCPVIPVEDLPKLIAKASEEGTLLQ